MANMTDELTKMWEALEDGTDGEYFADVMKTIGTLATSMSLTVDYKVNTIKAVQEYISVEKTLYDDFNKVLNDLRTETVTMSTKQFDFLDDDFVTEINTLNEKLHDRFVIAIGTAMINERLAWKKVPDMFKEIGGTPINLERIVDAAKDAHAAIKECDERAKKVLSSIGGESDVTKYNDDVIRYVLTEFEKEKNE